MAAWDALNAFRLERNRCKRYVFGYQWDDCIEVDGRRMKEKEFIWEQGQSPLKNNILRRVLRNVVGVYRYGYKVPDVKAASAYGANLRRLRRLRERIFTENRMEQLAPRLLEEFLISGLAVVRLGRRPLRDADAGLTDVRILPVTPDNFFFHSDGYDPRGLDVDMLGEKHSVSYAALVAMMGRSIDDLRRLEAIYPMQNATGAPCHVSEIWYKETNVEAFVHDRARGCLSKMPLRRALRHEKRGCRVVCAASSAWRCRWYADDGSLLRDDGLHSTHPYVWKAYPFLDGEVHSYVNDIIDQQRYVNHLITLYDFIMKSSAKGVLLFPDESMPRDMTLQDIADEWSKFNGVIPYRAQPGIPLPTQVSGNAANIGITELLKIEMQMFEDISGVSPTLQGKLENTAASGTLFAQQNQAAMTSLLDVVSSFHEFIAMVADCSAALPGAADCKNLAVKSIF